jgi:hypothetical protein
MATKFPRLKSAGLRGAVGRDRTETLSVSAAKLAAHRIAELETENSDLQLAAMKTAIDLDPGALEHFKRMVKSFRNQL